MSNSIGVRSTVWPACHTSLRCGSICREPKSSGASAEAATVEKSVTEARAVTVFAKMASSSSLKDRIINFPCGSPFYYVAISSYTALAKGQERRKTLCGAEQWFGRKQNLYFYPILNNNEGKRTLFWHYCYLSI